MPKQQYFTGEFNYLFSKISEGIENDSVNILPLLKRADSISVLENEKSKISYLWGQYYLHKQYPYRAISHFKSIEQFYIKKRDSLMLIDIAIKEAEAYNLSADYQKSQEILFRILKYTNLSISNKAEIFYLLSKIYSNFKIYRQAQIYADWAIIQAKRINDNRIWLKAIVQKGYILSLQQKFNLVTGYYSQALKMAERYNLYNELPNIYNTIAINNYQIGQKDSCLFYLDKGLENANKYKNHNGMAVITGNLGYFYFLQNKPQKAIRYLLKSKAYCKKYDVRKQLIIVYDNLAMAYARTGKYFKAYEYSQKYKLLQDSVYSDNTKNTLSEMSAKYEADKKNKEIELLNKGQIIQTNKLKRQRIIIYSGLLIGLLSFILLINLFQKNKFKTKTNERLKHKNDEIFAQKEEIMSQKEELEQVTEHLEQLSLAVRHTTNAVLIFNKSFELIWANSAFEKIYGFELNRILNKQLLYNYVRKYENQKIDSYIAKMIRDKSPKQFTNQRKNYKGEKIWIQSTISPYFDRDGALNRIIVVESDVTEIKRAQQKIQYQNKSITDSLNYAKTLQNNILPADETIKSLFDSFVIYRPQEIVSGDFYWMHKAAEIKNSWTSFVAMVDCTGHGVPAAFMSIIANSLLNRAIIEKQLYKPNSILAYLKSEFSKLFSHQQPDGFDIALCRIDKSDKNYTLYYSGAKIPLFYSENTKEAYKKIQADRKSIDVTQKNKQSNFNLHKLILNKGAEIVLTTDGIIDQANAQRKRFGTKQLLSLLNKNRAKELATQQQAIENSLISWLGGENQRDDVSIWGIRLK